MKSCDAKIKVGAVDEEEHTVESQLKWWEHEMATQ